MAELKQLSLRSTQFLADKCPVHYVCVTVCNVCACVCVWCVWQMTFSLNDGLWGINETFPLLTRSRHKTKQRRSECQTALLDECKSRHICDGWRLELQTGGNVPEHTSADSLSSPVTPFIIGQWLTCGVNIASTRSLVAIVTLMWWTDWSRRCFGPVSVCLP